MNIHHKDSMDNREERGGVLGGKKLVDESFLRVKLFSISFLKLTSDMEGEPLGRVLWWTEKQRDLLELLKERDSLV